MGYGPKRGKAEMIENTEVVPSCTRYSIQITDDFSTETQEDRRQWDGIFKVLKEKKPVKDSILSNTTLQK